MVVYLPFSNNAGAVVQETNREDIDRYDEIDVQVIQFKDSSAWGLGAWLEDLDKLRDVAYRARNEGHADVAKLADEMVAGQVESKKIALIKEFRTKTGSGLKFAKDEIEAAFARAPKFKVGDSVLISGIVLVWTIDQIIGNDVYLHYRYWAVGEMYTIHHCVKMHNIVKAN